MTKSIFANLNIALQSSSVINDIVQPLKHYFGITSVVYAKNYHNGSEIRLTNQPAWIEHYYKNQLYLNSGFEQSPKKLNSGFVVLSHLTHHTPILQQAREFNIDHSVSVMQKSADGCEMFFLSAASQHAPIANMLLNNLDVLHRFIYYFKEQAAGLIKTVDQHRIIIPNKVNNVFSEEQGLPSKKSINLSKVFGLKKACINPQLSLSSRELSVVKLFAQGKSARQIGELLFLSPRTIETHLMHLRAKLNCHSKPELIYKINELNLHWL